MGSLFDGIGGFPYAASFYGIRTLWASEIVPECVSITKRHFPDMAHMGDITRLHGGTLPPVDIITFGSPCQGLSTAGLRRGLADERSGLFMEAVRIIYEMREATHGKYPRFAIWENVPGCTSSAHGLDFAAVLSAFTKTKVPMPRSGRWANAGMVRSNRVDLAWIVYDSQHFGTAQRRRRVFLVCDFGGKRAGEILFVPKSLLGYFEAGGTPRQGLAAFAEGGADATGGDERSPLKPVQPICGSGRPHVVCMAASLAHAGVMDNQAPTLTTAHERPIVASAGFRYKAAAAAGSVGYQEETAPTLVAGQPGGVLKAFSIGACCSKGMLSGNPAVVNIVDCGVGLNVRRLTPLEAERLMGFDDFWTQYGHDGRAISDSKRYSMLGNSVSIPCVAYIMQGIRDILKGGD